MPPQPLRIVVTGASSGIGLAAARLMAQQGARVVVTARREAELAALVSAIREQGGDAVALAGDVRDERHAEALVALAVRTFGGLDIAFNNAGTLGAMGPTPSVTLHDWTETLAANLTSAFLGAKHQIPAMLNRQGGSLIFTSTFVGYTAAFPGMAEVLQRPGRGQIQARGRIGRVKRRPDRIGQRQQPQQGQRPGGQGVQP